MSRQSSLRTLNPFLDNEGLIRVNGRLANSKMTYDEPFPIILPTKSKLCENLIKFVHKVLIHGGTKLMMTTIRSQFYVPRLKRTVKKHVNNC